MFDPVDPKQPLPEMERGILQYWKEEDIFKRSVRQRSKGTGDPWDGPAGKQGSVFSFYDGPPFATGLPHYGHLLAGTIKDVIPRYQTMRGQYVERRFGWDCHGLPIENIIEQEQGIKSKQEIEEMGVDVFNELCRSAVQRYTEEWRAVVERMGRWVDMDWDYRTMDPDYMESMWWAFQQLHKKDLVYEGYKPMHICPRCVTPLSNFEVTQGYEDVTDHAVTVKFKLQNSKVKNTDMPTYILAWTTTPWTLPGNVLLAVGKKIPYVKVAHEGEHYIVGKDLLEAVFKDREHEVVEELTGKDLLEATYEPVFPYFANETGCFRVVEGDFVTTDEGTGVVHIAMGFGDDDYAIGQREGLTLLQHVTMDGKFTDAVTDFAGQEVKPKDDPSKTDRKLADWLEEHGKLFWRGNYTHSYPHCWRCDSPLLNYATSSWFVNIEKIKDKMLKNNAKTEWVPAHIRDGRYGKWLEGARDWAISRNRYWGTPLPIWRSASGDLDVVGSRDGLMRRNLVRFTKLTVLRHGESEGNTIPIYQGEMPGTDLTKRGQKQVQAAGKQIDATGRVDIIYTSPLARARQTAEAVAKETGAEVVVDERLRETRFGEYEGKTIDFNDLAFVKARRSKKLADGSPESIYHLPGMETWEDTNARIVDFLEDILPQHRSDHVVVVTHADPVQNIRHYFTNIDPVKLSHQPYPLFANPHTFYWDHKYQAQMDLHKHRVDDVIWCGSPSDDSVHLTLVRHGETDWNAQDKSQGGNDDIPLNDKGREQARSRGEALQGKTFDAIVSSDLSRAVETAQIISETLDVPHDAQWPELRERDEGEWSGQPMTEVLANNPCIAPTASFNPATPPQGESFSAFIERVEHACKNLLQKYAGKRVLVVCHGGTMRALKTVVENIAYRQVVTWDPQNGEEKDLTLHPFCERIPEVLDCWFESGSMPYSQGHFPFSQPGAKVPAGFPADFIAEGVDQTRAWFYTLMVLSTALFNETPFKHVVVNGIVLAEDGKKMSKRLKNYPEPTEIVEKYGADAIRFTLMSSPAVRGEDLRISERIIEESMRSVLLPLWNTYSFFVTYANACQFEPVATRRHSVHPLDTWIRAEVQDLCNRMTEQLEGYDLSATCSELFETIDHLTNWYVRLSRRRFAGKGSASDSASEQAHINVSAEDQLDALHTLYDVLLTLSQLLCPFCPYIADAIYLNLVSEAHGSIHLTDWPEPRPLKPAEEELLKKTRLMRTIVSLGLSVRGEKKIKVRQPLAAATVAVPPALAGAELTNDDLNLLKQELNVKDLHFTEDPGALAEAYANVDARKVGPRLGARVQEIIQAGKAGEFEQLESGAVRIQDVTLDPHEVQIVYRGQEGQDVAADKGIVVSVETALTPELTLEGHARDLIRTIQRLRKESGLSFTDTITLSVDDADELMQAHSDLITHETNAVLGDAKSDEHVVELGDLKARVRFVKV